MRYLVICAVLLGLSGCAVDVTMKNPKTGAIVDCNDLVPGANPWSQADACAADLEAQGWVLANSP